LLNLLLPNGIRPDKARLNNLTSQLKEEIKQLKNDTISEFLRELTNDSSTEYSLWKTTKNLRIPIMQTPPIKNWMVAGLEIMNKKH
jgi:hypothetical protein